MKALALLGKTEQLKYRKRVCLHSIKVFIHSISNPVIETVEYLKSQLNNTSRIVLVPRLIDSITEIDLQQFPHVRRFSVISRCLEASWETTMSASCSWATDLLWAIY